MHDGKPILVLIIESFNLINLINGSIDLTYYHLKHSIDYKYNMNCIPLA